MSSQENIHNILQTNLEINKVIKQILLEIGSKRHYPKMESLTKLIQESEEILNSLNKDL